MTNVFREPKEVNLLTSTPEKCCLERTKALLSCGEFHTQCCGSLRDPWGRAICGRFLAIGSLKGRVRLRNHHYEVRRQTFYLIYVDGRLLRGDLHFLSV
jgi:hypothetical protein